MKLFGAFFILVGIVWGVVAYNMQTTVTTGDKSIGSGEFSVYIPEIEVHNLGLMETRRNHLMFSGLSIVVGVLLLGFGNISSSEATESLKKCPLCAEKIQPDAKKCRYCGGELPESWSTPSLQEATVQSAQNPEGQLVIRICPSCRSTNNGTAKECFRCGARLPD